MTEFDFIFLYGLPFLTFLFASAFLMTFKKATNHVRGVLFMGTVLFVIRTSYFWSADRSVIGLSDSDSVLLLNVFTMITGVVFLKFIIDVHKSGFQGSSVKTQFRRFVIEGEGDAHHAQVLKGPMNPPS